MKCYAGYSKTRRILQNASSGGIVTSIAYYLVNKDYCVCGVKYSNDYRNVEYYCATNEDELVSFMGSKYVKANINTISGRICSLLDQNKKILFIGLPCDSFAIKKIVANHNPDELNNMFVIDMICSGVVKKDVLNDYISYLENIYKSRINDFSMRKKIPNWIPPYLYAHFENGMVYEERLYRTDFGLALSNMLNEGCYHCKLRGENRCSDITVGDMWGIDETHKAYNQKGVSVAIVHTENGDKLLSEIKDLYLSPVAFEDVIRSNPRYLSPSYKSEKCEVFKKIYKNKGLHFACIKSMNSKERMLYAIRSFITLIKCRTKKI